MSALPWYNANSLRSWPFQTDEVGQPVDGIPTVANLPLSAVVDFGCVLGVGSGFEADVHTVYLARVVRLADTFCFEFRSDAPALNGTVLRFCRPDDAADYDIEYRDDAAPLERSNDESVSSLSLSESSEASCEDDPLWSGFLVTGDLTELAGLMDPGDVWLGSAEVEPGTCQNLAGSFVSSLNLANQDRTRASGPEGCDDPVWPHETGVMITNRRCLQGALRLQEGHNVLIEQDHTQNLIRFSATPGAGAGQVCDQVPLFDGEQLPAGHTTFEGALQCHEALRSINGVGGRHFVLEAGPGISLILDPDNHRITLNVDMAGLAVCYSEESIISESI